MNNLKGVRGKLLRINLTSKKSEIEIINEDLWKRFLGGRGLGAYYLYNEVAPEVKPLDPGNNKLIFMLGPLGGTLIPGSNKICVTFKSPLTKTYSYSLCGGSYGPELKFAGYDGIIIEGKASEPCYLYINDNEVLIKSAWNIWGDFIAESEEKIREDLGGDKTIQIAVIGPSGENLCHYGSITSGFYREFGRGGAGAIMGSKNLKGIAISGSQDLQVENTEEVIELTKRLIYNLRNSNAGKVRRIYGTMELVERINGAGFWTTRNFSEGHFEEGHNLEGAQMREQVIFGDSSCSGCPIACGKRTTVKTEDGTQLIMEGPEFETVGMLGSNCGISSWETIMKASKICDSYGFDTINAGACVSMVMEAFEKGKISTKDTDGIEMKFGSDDALLQCLEKIGKQEGIGKLLAKGVAEAAEHLGVPELAIHSKGQSFPVYDPRGAKAMALTYATSAKGAHHMYATTFGNELALGNRFEIKGKDLLERNHQFSMAIVDSLGLCSTMRAGITLEDQVQAFSMVTGIPMTMEEINEAAERIINIERIYNIRLGLDRKDDSLPKRFLEEPMPKGESKGQTVDLETLLDNFYDIMGWDNNGVPKAETLEQLGLSL